MNFIIADMTDQELEYYQQRFKYWLREYNAPNIKLTRSPVDAAVHAATRDLLLKREREKQLAAMCCDQARELIGVSNMMHIEHSLYKVSYCPFCGTKLRVE